MFTAKSFLFNKSKGVFFDDKGKRKPKGRRIQTNETFDVYDGAVDG